MDSSINAENHKAPDTESPYKQLSGSLAERLETLTPSSFLFSGSPAAWAPCSKMLHADQRQQLS